MATKVIPMSEVKKHKKQKSVWMVINNEVYDVSNFMDEHPGGADALLDAAGRDATAAFEDVGHSSDARELMKKFRIGTLPSNERNINIEPCCKTRVTSKPSPAVVVKKSGSSVRGRRTPKSCQFSDSRSITPRASRSRTRSLSPRFSPRVHTVVVPRESNKWKWILLALGVAIIAGVAYKKFSSS